MFTDHVIVLFDKAITITSHDQLMIGVSVVMGLIYWVLLYFARKRIVIVKRSSGTEQLAVELSRIANALETLANRPADRVIAAAMRRQPPAKPPESGDASKILYSMFGR